MPKYILEKKLHNSRYSSMSLYMKEYGNIEKLLSMYKIDRWHYCSYANRLPR